MKRAAAIAAAAVLGALLGAGPAAASSHYSAAVMADAPATYWRLGDSAGTVAVDSSGFSRHGTYGGSITLGATGALTGDANTAVSFPNTASAAGAIATTTNPWSGADAWTVEAWVKRTDTTGADTIVGTSNTTGPLLRLNNATSTVLFDPNTGTSSGTPSVTWVGTPIAVGSWRHVALRFTDSTDTAELFVDGASQGTRAPTDANVGGSMRIGAWNAGAFSDPWKGELDEVALYVTALSDARIAAHHAAGTTEPGGGGPGGGGDPGGGATPSSGADSSAFGGGVVLGLSGAFILLTGLGGLSIFRRIVGA